MQFCTYTNKFGEVLASRVLAVFNDGPQHYVVIRNRVGGPDIIPLSDVQTFTPELEDVR